jgi:hypothetical protein
MAPNLASTRREEKRAHLRFHIGHGDRNLVCLRRRRRGKRRPATTARNGDARTITACHGVAHPGADTLVDPGTDADADAGAERPGDSARRHHFSGEPHAR